MNKRMLGPIMMDLEGPVLQPHEAQQLQHPAVGGVILFTRNYQNPTQLAALTASIREQRAELLIAADTEGGRVQRFRDGFVQLPAAADLGQLYAHDPHVAVDCALAFGWILAAELRAVDVDLAFAPVLDICGGVSQVIGNRAFATDPNAVIALTQAFSDGFERAGMACTGKHFPGHGYVTPDSHVELPVDMRSYAEIDACDFQPYRAAIQAGLPSVMVAHVLYSAIDAHPASISAWWIGEVLRRRLCFTGAVFSDDLSMGGLADYGDAVARTCLALNAGCDMIPLCNRPQDVAQVLSEAGLSPDPESQARLDALRRPRSYRGLDALRASPDYSHYFNVLQDNMNVKVEF